MPALDGLRGLAILMVFMVHANFLIGDSPHALGHTRYLLFGGFWSGVDLFFVLSGFLITGILLATKDSPAYYKSFFARRMLRIFPLYYLFVLVAVSVHRSSFNGRDISSLLFYYYNLHHVWTARNLPWVPAFWSLSVEEQFYIIWPFAVASLSNKSLRRLCIAGMVLALGLRLYLMPRSTVFQVASYFTLCRTDGLFAGALLAIWRRDAMCWKRVQHFAFPVGAISAIAIVGIFIWSGHFFDWVLVRQVTTFRHSSFLIVGPGISLLAILFATLVAKATSQGVVYRIFLAWPLRRMGRYSYGMYVYHFAIMLLLDSRIIAWERHHAFRGMHMFLLLPSSFVLTYLVSVISFHVYEQPILSFKRFFPAVKVPARAEI